MTGEKLKEILKAEKVVLVDLANSLKLSPQALNSKLGAKRLSLEFIEAVSAAINKNVYNLAQVPKGKEHSNSDRMSDLMTSMFDEVKENNSFLRSVLTRAMSEGAIVFDKNSPLHV